MNALLEGDVGRVGVVGLGEEPNLRPARKRTRVGAIGLAPDRKLETSHAFLDATGGVDGDTLDDALLAFAREGCRAVAVSAAFAVDDPDTEQFVSERAAAHGLPACAGHELSGRVRARDADDQRRDQREHPARRRADDDARRIRARRGRARRAAPRAPGTAGR